MKKSNLTKSIVAVIAIAVLAMPGGSALAQE